MKLVSWRFWALVVGLTGAWIVLGHFFDKNLGVVNWVSKWVIVVQPAAVILFVVIYTALGLRGPAKWWKTDFGNRIVLFPLAVFLSSCVLVWALLFHHGLINTPLSAWIYIGGYLGSDLVLLWGTYLWGRAAHLGRNGTRDSSSAVPDTTPGTPSPR